MSDIEEGRVKPGVQGWCGECRTVWVGPEELDKHFPKCTLSVRGKLRLIEGGGETTSRRGKLRAL